MSLCKSWLNGFKNCFCMVFIMLQTILFEFNISDGPRDFVLLDDLDILQYSCKDSINALCYCLFITHLATVSGWLVNGVIPPEDVYDFFVISCSYVTLQDQINVVEDLIARGLTFFKIINKRRVIMKGWLDYNKRLVGKFKRYVFLAKLWIFFSIQVFQMKLTIFYSNN